jgi:predicted alpha/beta hydrolase
MKTAHTMTTADTANTADRADRASMAPPPSLQETGASTTDPTAEGPEVLQILTGDGWPLGARLYHPLGPARGTVLIHGATAVPQTYYARFASWLADAGLRVLTYDYRGVGDSRPASLRGFPATMTDWARLDARAALDLVQERYGDRPIFLIGHSFGGQLLGLVDEMRDVAGALLVASQLGYYGHWPLPERLSLALTWYALIPTVTGTFGYLPGWLGLGTDLPAGVAQEWAHWCRHPEYFIGEHPDARERLGRFDRPLLLYSFTDDPYAPEPAVASLAQALASAPLTRRRLAPWRLGADAIGHFGFFRPRFAPTLWREALEFIDDVLAGRPAQMKAIEEERLGLDDLMLDLEYGRS